MLLRLVILSLLIIVKSKDLNGEITRLELWFAFARLGNKSAIDEVIFWLFMLSCSDYPKILLGVKALEEISP